MSISTTTGPGGSLQSPARTIFRPASTALTGEINRLKKELGITILAHTYQAPEIYQTVADIRGDSLALARRAAEVETGTMIVCGVHFMAETAKLLNPDKRVLIPARDAGCSLADSITAADIRELRRDHPGIPVVVYVNTSAEVKAEADICCTSSNAVEVVESLGSRRIIFLPDRHLAAWVAANTKIEIIPWDGSCEVHELFTPDMIRDYRREDSDIPVFAHPECPLEVLKEADMVGSTSAIMRRIELQRPAHAVILSEASLADNIAATAPGMRCLRPDIVCPHMKKITLEKILTCLRGEGFEIEIPTDIARRARKSVQRMLEISS